MPCLENQTGHLILQHAKQCAIICVEEMIQTMEPGYISPVNYWQKVKTEIEKL